MEKQFNPTVIYVLSIISFLCCCFAGLGIILAAPAFIMANNKMKDAQANPNDYDSATLKAIKTARTVAMIALIVNSVYLLLTGYRLATTDWSVFMDQYQEALEKYQ
ncbi:CCC motif membrane protein [Tenacibaculum ovolyticum]|uniref:CCC motif membrane protein n=1 Tax=Tenacibaculum ovolyticum TaxID=104270 RepID=UPI0004238661|nr:CCC motif membrane protein [Tenacibaculum ovolyticum]